jgi:hypothetical protein
MKCQTLARSLRLALAVVLATATQDVPAATVDFVVTVPASNPVTPALANAVSQNHPSSLYLTATNTRAGTNVTQVVVSLPGGYNTQPGGGVGPVGWVVTRVENGKVFFKIADCAQRGTYGIQAGTSHSSQTFRLNLTPPGGGISTDRTDHIGGVAPSDPCGGPTGWTTTSGGNILFQRKVLYVTAFSQDSGPSPFTTAVAFTVKNESNAAKTGVSLGSVTVTPSAGASYTSSPCTPASFSLNAGASQPVTCPYVLTAASGGGSTFTFTTTASGSTSATAVGVVAGPILVGPATATFAFESLVTAPGDTVQANLSVTNQTAGPITVTPPSYAQLTLTNLQQAAGTTDPAPASANAGGTAVFVYSLFVPGSAPLSSSYVASGVASTTAGQTNVATTVAGTVGTVLVNWAPAALVKSRATSPYLFTVTVLNSSASSLQEIDIVNPQNGSWTGLKDSGGSTLKAGGLKHPVSTTDLLPYTGTVAIGATATLNFQFTDIPPNAGDSITATKVYPFQVTIKPTNAANLTVTRDEPVADSFPIGEVMNVSVLSMPAGQTVFWANADTPSLNEYHDGVVILVSDPALAPPRPTDGQDYTVDTLPAGALRAYADKNLSTVTAWPDQADDGSFPVGAFNYRICNHDENFIYSTCSTGFWNGQGYLGSVALPTQASWAHGLGGQMLIFPGVVPGTRLGVAMNGVAAVNVLDPVTAQKSFATVPLPTVPSLGTPIAPLGAAGSPTLLFAADQSGVVTGLNIESGATWQITKAGESFVAGVGGALRRFAAPAFQARYTQDVLFIGSTTGNLFALDAATGSTLWTLAVGKPIRAHIHYDAATNFIYVPTDASDGTGGVLAYDLGTSSPLSPGTPPGSAAGWNNPHLGGRYTLGCTPADVATDIACADSGGSVRVFGRATGAATAGPFASTVSTPTTLWGLAGGLIVSSANKVVRLNRSGSSLSVAGTYAPAGVTLSPVQIFGGSGFMYVGGSDKKVHKLRLADAVEAGSVAVPVAAASPLLGPAVYDVSSDTFFFGSNDGQLWAVKAF